MGWNFRRSTKLPFGFRLNFSKRGIGYSWGVRGFRVGRNARGQTIRTLSIPGTGLYRRDYISSDMSSPSGASRGAGCLTIILGIPLIFLVGAFIASYPKRSVVSLVLIFGALAWTAYRRKASTRSASSNCLPDTFVRPAPQNVTHMTAEAKDASRSYEHAVPEPLHSPTGVETSGLITSAELTLKIREFIELAENPLRQELRKIRSSSNARPFLELDFRQLIVRFGCQHGTMSPHAANLYFEIFSNLHPSELLTLNPAEHMQTIAVGILNGENPEAAKLPFTLQFLKSYDSTNKTDFVVRATKLFFQVATQAASGNDKEAQLNQLHSLLFQLSA